MPVSTVLQRPPKFHGVAWNFAGCGKTELPGVRVCSTQKCEDTLRNFLIIVLQIRSTVYVRHISLMLTLTNTQINSLQFVINSYYSKIFMIKSNDDIRYCQDVFGCFPVADIVKRRTAKFLKKYKEANDINIVCQACIRY